MTKEQKSPEEIAQKILETMEDEIYGLEYSSGELKAAKYLIAQAIDNSNTEAIDWTDPKLKEHHPDGSIRPNRWARVDDEPAKGKCAMSEDDFCSHGVQDYCAKCHVTELNNNLEKAKAFIKAECYCEMDGDIAMHCANCDLLGELDV